ncbi:hypothetical protein Cgig2_004170 [Carnegiea gigantea]|uniref:F-box domain-containing protein n=1 Tax=Carnegiea gigantea TaxID=171969 RepID=A0A9Q1QQZ2_9CARY|nr:hypothetical protein Cgig2_004170 [Carnegiea gigantea]
MSTKVWELPEECLVRILSLISPEDILRSSAASKQLSSVAISDDLWKKLVPSDYDQIMQKSSSPLQVNSIKDLFVLLYRSHLLIDDNKLSIYLDKRSLKKCYMLGSRSLTIAWGDNLQHWSWTLVPGSRFPESAKLEEVCWLDIKGEISTNSLSQNTTYGAYLVFKLMHTDYTGFERVPVKVSVSEVDESGHHPIVTKSVYLKPQEESPEGLPRPTERRDGWMEIEMGTYRVGFDDGVSQKGGFGDENTRRQEDGFLERSPAMETMSAKIWELPEECLHHILFLTSPEDTLRSLTVSKQWFSVAISDDLWKKFLPSDYDQIIKESSSPLQFNSLKDLFVVLYRSHLLIDRDTKSIFLAKTSCKKCYMLGSKSLAIVWGDTPRYWRWISVRESRFPENANLKKVCWLDIKGAISTKLLSPDTTYGAYFVFKLTDNYTGFEGVPLKVSVSEVDETGHHPMVTNSVYLTAQEGLPEGVPRPVDGWREIQMGTYQVGGGDGVRGSVFLEMSVGQTEIGNWKHGLLIEGIELRPLD